MTMIVETTSPVKRGLLLADSLQIRRFQLGQEKRLKSLERQIKQHGWDEERPEWAQGKSLADVLLADHARYNAEVLAHTDPQWWAARAAYDPIKSDWLLDPCDGCHVAGLLPGEAAVSLRVFGAVLCSECRRVEGEVRL